MRVKLGYVGHFGLSVTDPDRSAAWWKKNFDLDEIFRFEGGIAISNDKITIALHAGTPQPEAFGHMAFHIADMRTLRAALTALRDQGVDLEDPGDEVGPEGPGSPNLGIWLHDPDGYRWELSVQNGAAEKS